MVTSISKIITFFTILPHISLLSKSSIFATGSLHQQEPLRDMASKYEQLFKQAQETQGPSIHTHPEDCFNNIDMSEIGWFDDLDMSCIKRLAQEAAKYSSSEQLLSTIKNR